MSYYFRRRTMLAKANPYHDELGRFTTADNAVMFVRPKWGYNASPTQDPKWAGAYKEGARFAVRRERNPLGEAAATVPTETAPNFLSNVVTAAAQTGPATVDPVAVARQLAAGTGTPAVYLNPEVEAAYASRQEIQRVGGFDRSELNPVYHGVIDNVFAVRDRLAPVLAAIGDDPKVMGPDVLKATLEGLGYKAKMLGADVKGINASFEVVDSEGRKAFVKLNHGDKYGWIGPVGGAIEEERSYAVLRQVGLGGVVNPVFRASEDVTVQPYFDTAGPMGHMEGKLGHTHISDAVRTTDGDLAKLVVAEYLLGDADKHRMNYNYYEGRIFGTDWSRTGVYTPFSSDASTKLAGTGQIVSKADILKVARDTTNAITSLFGDAKCYTQGDYPDRTRAYAANHRLDKLQKVLDTLPDTFRYTELHNKMWW